MSRRIIAIVVLLMMITNVPISAIEVHKDTCGCETHHHKSLPVKLEENSILNIRECISLGIQNSPIVKQKAQEYELAKANVGLAKSDYFPELSVGAGYLQEFNTNDKHYDRRYRELPNVGATINKMIYDFGKTNAKIKMEEFLTIAAEYEFEDAVCESVFEIKTHYYDLLRKKALLRVAQTNVDIQQAIIKEIEALIKQGKKTEADLLRAKVSLSQSKSYLLATNEEYENAKENLNNILYIDSAPNYEIYETQTFHYQPAFSKLQSETTKKDHSKVVKDDTIFQHPHFSKDEALKIAHKNSPDLKALKAVKYAMEQVVVYANRISAPQVNAGAGYNLVNNANYANNSFNVGVGIEMDYNAMANKYESYSANAQLKLAKTEIDLFEKNLQYRVRKALNSLDKAYKDIPLAKEEMDIAAKNLDMIFDNYKNNKNSYIDLLNAQDLYIGSLKNYVNANYDYNFDLIQLEMAMHEHLIDYHDDAEHAVNFHEGDESSTLGKLIRCNKKHKP